ncbi:hypothetical protein AHMF7605_11665 [Adhaeribacter arboris]|uniref:Uncharacterized protein n=1 Tax=Adhaeribacter arboris TaxID=2072846 RepID=A0A2T2YF39_9BACT|nr:hypothetical protein [Adhaeribacter arboris]PSR54129.1 hypothetical protein AHMF7605_11665 [Adhaeribacter arboris]
MATLNLLCAENLDIHLYQGDTLAAVLEFYNEADTPLPVIASTIQMVVKRNAGDTNVLFTFSVGNGLAVQGNQVRLVALGQLVRGEFYYDLRFTFQSGEIITYVMGTIRVV